MTEEIVIIEKFKMIGCDDRGITAEFQLPRKQANFVYITRKAKTLSGNTYHTGKHEATNPKAFILLSGKILFSYRKIDDNYIHQQEIQAPALIKISPYVTHKVEAIEDFIILECNSISDIQNDRTRENV